MDYEVVIIGGGAAGLSAALVLGRARRSVLLLDEGKPSNAPAHAIGGLLGQHETSPLELLERGRAQIAELPTVEIRAGRAREVTVDADGVTVDGTRAQHLVLATGSDYRRPDIPGVEELWGDTVFHCPFCHGWEVRGRPLAAMVAGPHGDAMRKLLGAWSDDVVLLDPEEVAELRHADGKLTAVVMQDGTEIAREGLLLRAPLEPRTSMLTDLGLELTDMGVVQADAFGRTSVPRVWAVGDVAEAGPNIALAIATGVRTAGGIVHDLLVG